jgi:CRP-like cAMP-binding protein
LVSASIRECNGSAVENTILLSLPDGEFEAVCPYLQPIEIAKHEILVDPEKPLRSVYFLNRGLVSLVIPTSDGRSVEVGLVGRTGVVGSPLAYGVDRTLRKGITQTDAAGFRIRAEQFPSALKQGPSLSRAVDQYLVYQLMLCSQTAACNRLHELEQRLARWLLMASDQVGPEFEITQEYLAQMLGTSRATVSIAASGFQRSGVITYTRGAVRVLNRWRLEKLSCECYASVLRFGKSVGIP